MSLKLFINILGWTGSILYLLAYALVSAKKTEGDSLLSTLPPAGTACFACSRLDGNDLHEIAAHPSGLSRVYRKLNLQYIFEAQFLCGTP